MVGSSLEHKDKKELSRQIGMEVASICGEHFLNLEHLHYGYWTEDLQVSLANLRAAQEKYADFLISHIPAGVKSILDVGSGRGRMSKILLNAGYKVDCVSPSPLLAKQTRDLLGNGSYIFECDYEDLKTQKRYDLILFSESFQYVQLEEAVRKTVGFLKDSGYLLICDFFKKDTEEKSLLSGGHPLEKFYKIVSKYPLKTVKDLDITEQTAPNIDIEHRIFEKVIHPVANRVEQLLSSRHPFLMKILKWKYRKKIDKLSDKYFSDKRTGESFKRFKSYRFLLYKKADAQNL